MKNIKHLCLPSNNVFLIVYDITVVHKIDDNPPYEDKYA